MARSGASRLGSDDTKLSESKREREHEQTKRVGGAINLHPSGALAERAR